ncbi:MAG TPA: beta-propeller fold lactonase family protein [Solirubrobacteraceae bacterium]|nr:beta-propeller fold lactonase family protein [Solirubrobacteraceae bacterium]
MKATTRLAVAALAACAALAGAVGAAPALADQTSRAVFVQTDGLAGNEVIAYERTGNALTQVGAYPTGGLGGQLEGSQVDHLASQGALAYDRADGLLYAVDAGSDTVSVFAVIGDQLALHQVISSGGSFPVSVAVHGGVVYVLNALEGGELQGFTVSNGRLSPLAGSSRALGLEAGATPQFTHTPGQVAFTPGGSQLIVTTKANGEDVDVFAVEAGGLLSSSPTVNPLPGTVPFAVDFDQQEHLVVAEAAGFVAGFQLQADGEIQQLDSVPTGQAATCWITDARGRFYLSNAGSGSLSAFQTSAHGQLLTALGDTPTDAGTVDAAASANGRYLYVQTGGEGIVDEFAVASNGSLGELGKVTVPGAVGGEGIVAG